ncbi:hypothetical protein QJS10_CPB12g00651 [Acorus calamus]|uniref:Uncharacterized protein n=1 Tax=Acorus calamus TaxID=4465 RepID=A0AAV9DLG7_ACOCL|nr:hypothetical protein QJS10_CPB12g00651 [Acorus calamus]
MDDEDWITVRSVEHDEGEQLIKGEEGVLSLTINDDDDHIVLLDDTLGLLRLIVTGYI